ncbi:transposase, partial [Escherichia coli]|uniref:transposase n=1 Tax=Escherichia coli TaxID=562 RepID=UPI002073F1C4
TAVIEPFYPKAGNGRRPYPLETMLRIHCMQHWYNLSDGAMEDALYEIASMRLFARLSLDSALPDRTTIMNFRHLLEQHQLLLSGQEEFYNPRKIQQLRSKCVDIQ